MTRVLALHGVATDPGIWAGLPNLLPGMEILAPQRPCSGDLDTELEALAAFAADSWVIALSGGATLGLALASRVRMSGALLHEPAVGSLLPGLLAPMRAAFQAGGSPAFATTLYGPSWVAPAELDDATTARELEMFGAFEVPAPLAEQGPVVVTWGEYSLPVRRDAANALHAATGIQVEELPGTGHDVVHQNLAGFAARLRQLVESGR